MKVLQSCSITLSIEPSLLKMAHEAFMTWPLIVLQGLFFAILAISFSNLSRCLPPHHPHLCAPTTSWCLFKEWLEHTSWSQTQDLMWALSSTAAMHGQLCLSLQVSDVIFLSESFLTFVDAPVISWFSPSIALITLYWNYLFNHLFPESMTVLKVWWGPGAASANLVLYFLCLAHSRC